ncbi:MAG: transposase domain-containing protein [Phycisphaerae bacterium]|nr:transposase domain-containing protein [Phycisphaerae bacterium]
MFYFYRALVTSYKLNNIDPFTYFRDVVTRISTHPAKNIDQLLPTNWQPPTS